MGVVLIEKHKLMNMKFIINIYESYSRGDIDVYSTELDIG